MNWIHTLMEHIQALPETTEEWLSFGADTVGLTVTILWVTGAQHLFDAMMHSGIAVVTLASVSFSLYTKVRKHRQDKQNGPDKQL